MAKASKKFVCTECEHETRQWLGKCPSCNEFGTLKETFTEDETISRAGLRSSGAIKPIKKASTFSQLSKKPISRIATGIGELDRVLGGGFVDAEVILFAGFPGSGKSTLSLSIANKYANKNKIVLYSSGEESEQQIGLRAKRMGVKNENIKIINETSLETLLGHIEEVKPDLLIVDSIQTLASGEIPGSIGSVQQSREVAHTLTRIAKTQGITMVLISQVIKSGDFSGSESIQHIVDCALMLESDNDTPLKFLRASKNRFGDTTEVGVFRHTESGLEEVADPSDIFLETSSDAIAGASCSFITEGVRQIPVEIQALVSRSTLPQPRKQFNGINFQRGQIVCAILDKFCRAKLYEHDVFISTVSGIRVADPQADLSIAASILSSLHEKPISHTVAFVGELSLTGQVRGSFMVENKVREAIRLGFTKIIVPEHAKIDTKKFSAKIIKIESIKSLVKISLN